MDNMKFDQMIPFVSLSPTVKVCNNKSTIINTDFVNQTVLELSSNECLHEVPYYIFCS